MATRRVLFALLAACVLLLVMPVSFADSHARIVRLSDIEGSVQIDRNTGQGFEKAIMNMPITHGVRLQTGDSGRAEVEFENGSALRLAENTSVEFSDLSLRSDGQRVTDVRLNDGTVYMNFKQKGGDDFRLDAGNQAINLDHDVHLRFHLTGNDAEIAVFKGEVQVPHGSEMTKVKKGETLNLDLKDPSRVELAKGVTGFGADEWDSERVDYNTQYASNYNRNQYPYQYGYSDLTYYGGFFNAPGYGNLWRPFGVSTMWDPFGDGAWAYYPGAGYMWVSSYPWGWMPYRYGRWVYVPAYGWGWQPGGWNTWNSYPVYVNAPPTWHQPTPPPATGGNGSTVIVGNPVFTRPVRPVPGGAVHSSTAAAANQSAAGAAARPGRTGFSKEAQPPSAINRAVRVDNPGDNSAKLPASKAQQIGADREARVARPAGTPAKAAPSTAPAATPPPAATPTPTPRPGVQPTPGPRPAPTPHSTAAPLPKSTPAPHASSMGSSSMSGMRSGGTPGAHASSAARATAEH